VSNEIKLYTSELCNEILKQFTDIEEARRISGSIDEIPPSEWLGKLKPGEQFIIVSPNPIDFVEEDEVTYQVIYKFDIVQFVKLALTDWRWSQRFNQGQILTNLMHSWAKSIENKTMIDNSFSINSAKIIGVDYSPISIISNDIVKLNIVAVAINLQIVSTLTIGD
jgi:hypothetical protein